MVEPEKKKYKVLWIDQNVKEYYNQKYYKEFEKDLEEFEFFEATTVEKGYEILEEKGKDYPKFFVITSGRLSLPFLLQYEEKLKKMNVATTNIIFCFLKEFHEKKIYAYDPWYNPGGIVKEFKEVVEFLKKRTKEYENSLKTDGTINKDEILGSLQVKNKFVISTNNDITQIMIPTILGKLLNESLILPEEVEKFNQFIFSYGDDTISQLIKPTLDMPFEFLAKFFIKGLFGNKDQTVNKDFHTLLTNDRYDILRPMILTLYNGLSQNMCESYTEKELYSGTLFSKQEVEQIKTEFEKCKIISNCKDVKNVTVMSKSFIRFSKKDHLAKQSVNKSTEDLKKEGNTELQPVVLVIDPPENKTYKGFIPNIDSFKCGGFKDEVICLPFACFEVTGINFKEKSKRYEAYYEIHLGYLEKYEKDVIDYIDEKAKKDYTDEKVQNVSVNPIESIANASPFLFNFLGAESIKNAVKKCPLSKKVIIWIDQFCSCKKYLDYEKNCEDKLKDFTLMKATTIEEGFYLINQLEFRLIYVIVGKGIAKKFFEAYPTRIKESGNITANIILDNEPEEDEEAKKKDEEIKPFIGNAFLNPGKLVKTFDEAIEYFNSDQTKFTDFVKNLKKTINRGQFGATFGKTFLPIASQTEIIKKKEDVTFPKTTDKTKLKEFINFISEYGNPTLVKLAEPTNEKDIEVPDCLFSKFFIRLYGIETPFYGDMNKSITNFGIKKYKTYLDILKTGLGEGLLISYNGGGTLYRGTLFAKKEFNELSEKIGQYVYQCNFLSFSKDPKQALGFYKHYRSQSGNDLYAIIIKLIIPPTGIFMNNIEMRHYSGHASEKEVLLLPYSCYKIVDDSSSNPEDAKILKDVLTITLEYAGIHSEGAKA